MIKALRPQVRPDNMRNQVRSGGRSLGRMVYLLAAIAFICGLALNFLGPMLYLDGDGLVSRERNVTAPIYTTRVLGVHVRPGDLVRDGQPMVTVHSYEMLERIADATAKKASLVAREDQIAGRLASLEKLTAAAAERLQRARMTTGRMDTLAAKDLVSSQRFSDVARELYEAEREAAQLAADRSTLRNELSLMVMTKNELENLLGTLQGFYNGGLVLARGEGQVGPRLPSPGAVFKTGEVLYEIYRGPLFVLAYVPNGRLFEVRVGDRFTVTDGTNRQEGVVEEIGNVSDALPAEFQSTFRGVERRQIMKIALVGEPRFALLAKIKVAGTLSPTNLIGSLQNGVSHVAGLLWNWLAPLAATENTSAASPHGVGR